MQRPPDSLMRDWVWSPSSRRTSPITTAAPSAASSSAVAAPIPREPPLTRATFPSTRMDTTSSGNFSGRIFRKVLPEIQISVSSGSGHEIRPKCRKSVMLITYRAGNNITYLVRTNLSENFSAQNGPKGRFFQTAGVEHRPNRKIADFDLRVWHDPGTSRPGSGASNLRATGLVGSLRRGHDGQGTVYVNQAGL